MLAVTGDTPESCENLGDTLLHHDRFAEAEVQLRKVLALDAKHYTQTPGELAQAMEGQGRFPEAITVYRGVLQDHPEDANTMFRLAEILGQECWIFPRRFDC